MKRRDMEQSPMTARLTATQMPIAPRVCREEGSSAGGRSRSWRSAMSIMMASIWKCVPMIPQTWKTWWLCPAAKAKALTRCPGPSDRGLISFLMMGKTALLEDSAV